MTEGDQTVDRVAVVTFERTRETADEVAEVLREVYERVDVEEYRDGVFADVWHDYDCVVATMATGIVVRKVAPLLVDKWDDPGVVAVDDELTWAVPLVGGHHGANRVARTLADLGAVPTLTTGTEVAGEQSVEARARALDAQVVDGDSTVATNLAVLEGDLGPVARVDGPKAVLVDDEVTVLQRSREDGVVLGTGSVTGAEVEQFHAAWEDALSRTEYDLEDVEFVATATKKADEPGLLAAADALEFGVVALEKEVLDEHEGPSGSRARELTGWPGVAEASAIAASAAHDLILEKTSYDGAVTVAIAR